MPASTAPDDEDRARALRAAVAAQRALGPGDTTMQALRDALPGPPALVRAPTGAPAFWLVPFERDGLACGYARVGLDGRLGQLSQFGANASDRAAWPQASYFQQAPQAALAEIRARHPQADLGEPVLSYDGSPAKWAWRVTLGEGARVAYVLPGGWYESAGSGGEHGIG